jgi:protein-tyrosine phosphatase
MTTSVISDPVLPDVGTDHRRVVPLFAVHNFRDMGGYPTVDGRVTRWHRVFRADGLQRLTDGDLELLRPFRLRTVIDLRTIGEIEEWGRFDADQYPLNWVHLPIVDATWHFEGRTAGGSPHEFLVNAYRDMLRVGAERFNQALHLLAEPSVGPVVFHCAAGKDRTGLVAALALAAVGVPDEYIAADYGLTVEGMARTRLWAETHRPALLERMNSAPPGFMAALPSAMLEVLDDLRRDHGSIDAYLATIGVTPAVIEGLRVNLLSESTPAD